MCFEHYHFFDALLQEILGLFVSDTDFNYIRFKDYLHIGLNAAVGIEHLSCGWVVGDCNIEGNSGVAHLDWNFVDSVGTQNMVVGHYQPDNWKNYHRYFESFHYKMVDSKGFGFGVVWLFLFLGCTWRLD